MTASKRDLLEVKQPEVRLEKDQPFSFVHFAPAVQQIILDDVDNDIDVKSEPKSHPYQGLKLFNDQQDMIANLANRLKLSLDELAKDMDALVEDEKKFAEYNNKLSNLRILILKYPSLLNDNKALADELFPGLEHHTPEAFADYYVLWGGEPAELKVLIQNQPHLVSRVGEARNSAGQKVAGTLYRKALGGGDFEMADMLKEFLTEDEADRQYAEQFPEGWEKAAAAKLAENMKALDAVWQALREAKTDNTDTEENLVALKKECKPGVDKFKQHLSSGNEEVITIGYHFDLRFLLRTVEYINQKINEIGGWWHPKEYLFWEQLFGSLELQVSARDMHELLRGLWYFDENKPAPRTLKLKDGTLVYSRSAAGEMVGDNASIDLVCAPEGWRARAGRWTGPVGKLISSKNRRAGKFMPRSEDTQPIKQNWCTIL